MHALRRRPASAAALLCSVLWIGAVIWEIVIRSSGHDIYGLGPAGTFFKTYEVLQFSLVGVVGFLALAILIERVWPTP